MFSQTWLYDVFGIYCGDAFARLAFFCHDNPFQPFREVNLLSRGEVLPG